MRTLSLLAAGAIVAAASPARADQCAVNPKPVVDNAATLVQKGARVLEFCEPCGDGAPGAPYIVRSVVVRDGKMFVDGELMDLAYLFVETGGEFANVGLRAQCGAVGVSRAIRNGRPTGPIDAKAPATPTPPGPRPPLPPGPPAPPSPPYTLSANDLAGTWSVRFTTRSSTCAAPKASVAEWTITYDHGMFELKSDDGRTELEGTLDSGGAPRYIRATLNGKHSPSATVLRLGMFSTDRYSGTLLRGEPTAKAKDPICVTLLDVDARRR